MINKKHKMNGTVKRYESWVYQKGNSVVIEIPFVKSMELDLIVKQMAVDLVETAKKV